MFLFVNFKNIYFHVSSDFFFKFEVWASLVAQMVKNLPAMWVWSLVGRSPGEGNGYPL